MKKPENFNAGATVKKSNPLEDAINGNFSNVKPSVVATPSPSIESVEKKVETAVAPTIPEEKEKKEKFLISMEKGERAAFKAFCAMNNISMNHFVICAMDYFKEDLEAGKVTISQHSYKRQ
jgi:hypothetical protein